jgi:uncharacterized membrane protein
VKSMRFVTCVRRYIERLGPRPSLFLLAVPLAIIEPLKLVAVVIFGSGHWLTGTLVMLGSYAAGLFFVERLFKVVKPKLLTLPWFALAWTWFVTVRDKTCRWLLAFRKLSWRRKSSQTGCSTTGDPQPLGALATRGQGRSTMNERCFPRRLSHATAP